MSFLEMPKSSMFSPGDSISMASGLDPRLAEVGLVAAEHHGGDDPFQQRRRADPQQSQRAGDPVGAGGHIGHDGHPKVGQRGLAPVGAVKRVDREIRQQRAIDQRRGQPGGAGRGPAEEERNRHRGAHRLRNRLLVGVKAVNSPVVPRQPHRLAVGQVRDGNPSRYRRSSGRLSSSMARSPNVLTPKFFSSPRIHWCA